MSRKRGGAGEAAERIRARLANELAPEQRTKEETPQQNTEAAARQHFMGSIAQMAAGRSVERIPVGHIAPDLRPEMRQPRMLPLPEEIAGSETPTIYRELLSELRALGQSLQERQIQPIVVYPGSSDDYPAARYLLLVGQRRWTAAVISGMKALDTIIVEQPTAADRVRLQYRENEEREDFSDMERAWAITQLRAAIDMGQGSIETVSSQLGIRRARAYQLLRLLALSPAQQQHVALLRLQETQLRTMIDALHRNLLTTDQVDAILNRLAAIAIDRAHQAESQADQQSAAQTRGPRHMGIDAPTVARLVARTVEAPLGTTPEAAVPARATRWYGQLRASLSLTAEKLHQAESWVEALGQNEISAILFDLRQLHLAIEHATAVIEKQADRE